jgi:hypothetical protein
MNILILGDSYSDDSSQCVDTVSWVQTLAQHHTVTNWSLKGSTLAWSFDLWQRHHNLYDKVVVTVTQPGRLCLNTTSQRCLGLNFLPNLRTIEYLLPRAQFKNPVAQRILTAARDYYAMIYSAKEAEIIHNALLSLMINPLTLLIPCYDNSLVNTDLVSLFTVGEKELTVPRTDLDTRCCHLNQTNHNLLAQAVLSWIETGHFDWFKK